MGVTRKDRSFSMEVGETEVETALQECLGDTQELRILTIQKSGFYEPQNTGVIFFL